MDNPSLATTFQSLNEEPPEAAQAQTNSSTIGNLLSTHHVSTLNDFAIINFGGVLAVTGHPFSHANFNTARYPLVAAPSVV